MERSRAAPRDMVVVGRAAPAKPRQPQMIGVPMSARGWSWNVFFDQRGRSYIGSGT